jgi:fructokinase
VIVNKNKSRVLCFGETLFDIIEEKDYLGGAPTNVVCHLAKLGVESYISSAVGSDERATKVISALDKHGVYTKHLLRLNKPTGIVQVRLSKDGQPDYEIKPDVAYDYIEYKAEVLCEILSRKWDAICFGTVAQRNEVSRSTLKLLLDGFKNVIFYDVNLRKNSYTKEIIESSIKFATVLKLNNEEADLISEMFYGKNLDLKDFCTKVSSDFCTNLILITCGDEGCFVYEDSSLTRVPSVKVEIADTIGAGDAFSAAFLCKYLQKYPAVNCAEFANQLAALVASKRGAVPEYDLNELRNY